MKPLYTMALVDDESGQVDALAAIIERIAPAFEVHRFYRSADVLQYLTAHTADVLLSDIRMPGMDGLELARKVHELSPGVVIGIITAYSDFEYARRAINIGVSAYLVKPISPQKLRDLTQKLTDELAERRANAALATEAEKLRQFDSEQNLYAYLTGQADAPESLPPALAEASCGLVAVTRLNGSLHRWESLSGTLTGLFAGQAPRLIRPVQSNRDLIVLAPLARDEAAGKYAALFDRFSQQHSDRAPIRTGLALWREAGRMREAYRQAYGFLDTAYCLPRPLTLTAEAVDACRPLPDAAMGALESELLYSLRQQESESVSAAIGAFARQCERERWVLPSWQAKEALNHILGSVYQYWAEDGVSEVQRRVVDSASFQEALDTVRECLARMERTHAKRLKETMEGLLHRVVNYVQDHYREELTLEQVAGLFHLSPSYLSSLFKQYAQCGFKEYLINARIREAKRLLRQTDRKVYEIARDLGYADAAYFVKLFRREVGLSPSRYRGMEGDP